MSAPIKTPFTQEELCSAFDCGEFVPYFQPLVDVRSGEIHGFEILARWEHPNRGLIPPDVFIPLIERFTLMNNLTAAVLIPAFAVARNLPGRFGLSVNLSPTQLHDRSLPGLLEIMAEEAHFDLRRLTVELTESALVDDIHLAGKVAEDLKQRGIRLSLDDFGTGYSSLLHLQSLPFDELKVDASFVRSITQSRQSRKITAAVISLGLSLGLQTVAEGIEEQSQANLLAWQGCDLGQGHLYGRAVPAAELAGLLARPQPFPGVTTEVPASIRGSFLPLDARPVERFSQLRAIYDTAPVGLAFLDTQLRYVNLNQRLAQINDRSLQAHLGRNVSEIVDPRLYAQFEPYLKRTLQGESFTNIEITKPARPGVAPKTLIASHEPVRDEAGEILGVCVSVVDITLLKQKDEALRESEDHYRHTVELNPQIPWLMDAEGNNIFVSSRWTAFTGMSAEQTKKLGWLDALHPDDRDAALAATRAALKTGNALDIEYRARSEGGWVWMRSRGFPRRDAEGRIIRWYGSVESIDEHKRSLDELRCSEARLRAVFEAAPVGIGLVESATHQLLAANPRIEEIIGFRFTPGMIWSSESLRAFDTNGELLPAESMPVARCIRSGETTNCEELFLERSDGSSLWISITVAPVRLDNGTQWGAVVAVQDIDGTRREHHKLLELTRVLESVAALPAVTAGFST
jgi:PAS domain S-box-containing protein